MRTLATLTAIGALSIILQVPRAELLAQTEHRDQRASPPCAEPHADPSIRQAQESRAFARALRLLSHNESRTLARPRLAEICDSTQSTSPTELTGQRLVYFRAKTGSEQLLAVFGVGDSEVILLNPTSKGHLRVGLDLRAWNRFRARSPKLPSRDETRIVRYACLVYSLAENMFPAVPVDPEAVVTLSGDSSVTTVALPSLRTTISFGRHGEVRALERR